MQLYKIVVTDAPTTHHMGLYLGMDLGIFKKHGIEIGYIPVNSLDAAKDAVAAGKADIFFACPTFTMAAISQGAPVKVIAQAKIPCTSVLVVPQNSTISRVKDIAGKKIAGISPTCEATIAYIKAVKDLNGSFELVKLAPAPAMAALEAGVVDAAILEEPYASIMELKGYKLVLREIVDVPCRFVGANSNFLTQKTDVVRRFVAALDEANELFNSNPQEENIVAIAHKYTGAPEDAIRHGNPRIRLTTKLDIVRNDVLNGYLVSLGVMPRLLTDEELYAKEMKGITW
ncbi:MAG: ABC transporter substrate-binding protein [Candidatus Omnitrophica bacterium]|nr:ABC transporter substrate-binding protein [Candidatus Omnitrophota bacterium]MCG2702982.1 ABC transporter substrate-binding protein [Candidatus Omnitrophota bacterium]